MHLALHQNLSHQIYSQKSLHLRCFSQTLLSVCCTTLSSTALSTFSKTFLMEKLIRLSLTSYSGKTKVFNALSDKIHFNFSHQLIALATAANARFGSLNINGRDRILSPDSCSAWSQFSNLVLYTRNQFPVKILGNSG